MPVCNTSTAEKKNSSDGCSVSYFPLTGFHLVSTELIDIRNKMKNFYKKYPRSFS